MPESIRRLATWIDEQGGRAFLVGGVVRDHLMGVGANDWDVEVFGVQPDDLVRRLESTGSVNEVGRSFGVYKWRARGEASEHDVSIPRRDSKVGPGHRGIQVEGDPTMTPREAARRRDLTVNALMYDIVADRIEDPWGGLDDLRDQRLRAVDAQTFLEDPLRALRVAQFAARTGFAPTDDLVALCRVAQLDELPAERVQGEWYKLLVRAGRPSLGFAFARRAELLRRVFPEAAHLDADAALDALAAGPRGALQPEGRAWALMLTAWLADADPATVTATLDRLWLHVWKGYPLRERVLAAVPALTLPIGTDPELRRLSTRAEPRLVIAVRAARSGHDLSATLRRAAELGVLDERPAPLLLGRHLQALGLRGGPAMGRILALVYEQQLEGAVNTLDEAIEAGRRLLAP